MFIGNVQKNKKKNIERRSVEKKNMKRKEKKIKYNAQKKKFKISQHILLCNKNVIVTFKTEIFATLNLQFFLFSNQIFFLDFLKPKLFATFQ